MPTNTTKYNWTNKMPSGEVFTNEGASNPTNTPTGIYFNGVAGDYFADRYCPVHWSNSVDSAWFCVTPETSAAGGYNSILCTSNSSAGGAYLDNASSVYYFLYYPGSATVAGPLVLGNQYDVAYKPGASTYTIYTNGISAVTPNTSTQVNSTIWGVGWDNGNDGRAVMYLKFVLICTNYTFTSTDISNLHTYATGH